ncbi:MAG: DUF1003 domain-containing protein [Ignavibacteriae bacterium]|nr:DUF1003 domain-containing protein [Ignavibacteriota bacterium]
MIDQNFLSKISIFSSLGEADLHQLKSLWKPLTKEEGQLLFKKGDPGNSMFIIKEGEIAVTLWTENNQQTILSVFGEGDFFGELALFGDAPRSANAKALKRTSLLEMNRKDFNEFLLSRPQVCLTMLHEISERLRATNEMMERSASKNVNEEIEHQSHLSDRFSDIIARVIGSWKFIISFLTFFFSWILLNTIQLLFQPFDSFPFTFLNLMLSTVSAIQAPIILMSQNRQSKKDRIKAELDYQVNRKAEMQIQSLHVKLDELRATEIHELLNIRRDELALLKKQ